MKDHIIKTLHTLRSYAIQQGYEVGLLYHEEDSHLMRFANSAISLNTNEHLIRLEVTAYEGCKRASYELVTDLSQMDEMKAAIDTAVEMAHHSQSLDYQPTITEFLTDFVDEAGYDPGLATVSNKEKLEYINQAVIGLESTEIKLSGIFSSGTNIWAQMNTRSEHIQYFKTSDAQISVVLAHMALKWEITAEQSANKKTELNPQSLQQELSFLIKHYQNDEPQQLPLGKYDIVFGQAAIADMLDLASRIGFNGGSYKRGVSFLNEDQIGKKVFSEKITLIDDPSRLETFAFRRDFTGLERKAFPLVQHGVFQGFAWLQDDADEFGAQPSGHTVPTESLVLSGGDQAVATLEKLVKMPRDKDLLYIPFLHYMNIVNSSKGVLTGSSRFGALLLKQDGSVVIPYNVRITQSVLDIFGDKVQWLSQATAPYNTSRSYGARNPTALIVPLYMRVNDLEISHSNSSY